MAYANNRIGLDVPETEIVGGRLIQLNPIDLFMQEHPEIGLCFYDLHSDGSGVFYSSRLRPIVNLQPKHIGHLGGVGSNLWQFNADTHILDWLEQLGQSFDVITDEDLETEGVDAIAGYRVVITGSHPEYYSLGMLDSLQGHLDRGGRLMYLGGNGFYWRISYHPTLPGVIECRKSEDGRASGVETAARQMNLSASAWFRRGSISRRPSSAPRQAVTREPPLSSRGSPETSLATSDFRAAAPQAWSLMQPIRHGVRHRTRSCSPRPNATRICTC
jgi:hypothetical protein